MRAMSRSVLSTIVDTNSVYCAACIRWINLRIFMTLKLYTIRYREYEEEFGSTIMADDEAF